MPVMSAADLHASILLPAEFLIAVLVFRQILFLACFFGFRFHYFHNLMSPLSEPNKGSFFGIGTLLMFISVSDRSPDLRRNNKNIALSILSLGPFSPPNCTMVCPL